MSSLIRLEGIYHFSLILTARLNANICRLIEAAIFNDYSLLWEVFGDIHHFKIQALIREIDREIRALSHVECSYSIHYDTAELVGFFRWRNSKRKSIRCATPILCDDHHRGGVSQVVSLNYHFLLLERLLNNKFRHRGSAVWEGDMIIESGRIEVKRSAINLDTLKRSIIR